MVILIELSFEILPISGCVQRSVMVSENNLLSFFEYVLDLVLLFQ